MDPAMSLHAAADRLDLLAASTTAGNWQVGGLLASRPEIVARRSDGSTEHVAEARANTATWIAVLSPAVAGPLAAWLRAAAAADPVDPAAVHVARVLLDRLP